MALEYDYKDNLYWSDDDHKYYCDDYLLDEKIRYFLQNMWYLVLLNEKEYLISI